MATVTFNYTGAVQTFVVPEHVVGSAITIECWGAEGGSISSLTNGAIGGLGGYAKGNLAVTAGETLRSYVGGKGTDDGGNQTAIAAGGYNGGGNGGDPNNKVRGAGGGGASDVRQGGTALSNRKIVGAGGGGGGGGAAVNEGTGGAGGASTGAAGVGGGSTGGNGGGGGGTQSAGGAGGVGTAVNGVAGTLGVGGRGSNDPNNATGGGGGGGYYGGGGGGSGSLTRAGGGGGGSNYVGGVSSTTNTRGLRSGNGQIKFTYTLAPSIPTALTLDNLVAEDNHVRTNRPTFRGSIAGHPDDVGGLTHFIQFEISKDPGFSQANIVQTLDTPSYDATSANNDIGATATADLENNRTYWVRARGGDSRGNYSDWTASLAFEVLYQEGWGGFV